MFEMKRKSDNFAYCTKIYISKHITITTTKMKVIIIIILD
jgi:hypothetical protein